MHVAGAGRKIDEQVIELSPFGAKEALLKSLVGHGAPPDERFVPKSHVAHGDKANAMSTMGYQPTVFHFQFPVSYAHHDGNSRPINVTVHEPHPGSGKAECSCKIDGDSRFSDAPLAASYRNDIPYPRNG